MRIQGMFVAAVATLLIAISPALGEEDKEAKPIPDAVSFVTQHSGTFGGQRVRYTVTAGETHLTDKDGDVNGSIFSFAYVASGGDDAASRPVAFIWNGGPGSASVWLHMGTLGPKRVIVPSDAEQAGAPPYPVVDNPETLLDIIDLVFVDPVGTGFSRPLGKSDGKEFWGTNEDTASMVQFIRRWITDNGRWNSPKFLIGESFGTTRNAAVAGALEGRAGISLNGIIMISQALDYTGSTPADDNLIAFITYFPTMAATAAYHGKVEVPGGDLDAFLADARVFAVDDLLPALFKGSALGEDQRLSIATRYAAFTGLDVEYVLRSDLRVKARRFRKHLLRDEGLSTGQLDARYTGDDIDDTADASEGDAASFAIGGAYTAALNTYMRGALNITMDREYKPSGNVRPWNYRTVPEGRSYEPSYVKTARDLSGALRRNKDLKVLIASGLYDMITPFLDAEYTFARHGILKDRLTFTYYPAGHMMYLHDPSRVDVLRDMRAFIEAAK